MLSSFYFGYIVMHIPGGYLARKFGGATVIGLSVGGTGALTLFTPLAARIHVGLLIALRVAVGLAEVKREFFVFVIFNYNMIGLIGQFPINYFDHGWKVTIASPRSKLYASLSKRLYSFLTSRFAEIFVLILRESLQTPLTKALTSSPRATLTLLSCLATFPVQL